MGGNRWLCCRSGSRLEEPLCLLKTPSVGVYPAGNEVRQAGEMKGAVTCVTAALFECRCVKCSKSFAELFDHFRLCLQAVPIYLG